VASSFHTDLDRGLAVEQKVLDILQSKYPSSTLINAYKGYDIWIPEINKSIEVKYDPMSNKTGNYVVEIEMSGKLSALMTTTASYWVFYDDNKFLWLRPMDIINCIFQNKLTYVTFNGSGDYNSKKAFLIKKELLFKHAIGI
jgi:hypothetical protein